MNYCYWKNNMYPLLKNEALNEEDNTDEDHGTTIL